MSVDALKESRPGSHSNSSSQQIQTVPGEAFEELELDSGVRSQPNSCPMAVSTIGP